jgi:hypothetical protein
MPLLSRETEGRNQQVPAVDYQQDLHQALAQRPPQTWRPHTFISYDFGKRECVI